MKLFPDTADLADTAPASSDGIDKFFNPSFADVGRPNADRDLHQDVVAEFGDDNYQRGSQ